MNAIGNRIRRLAALMTVDPDLPESNPRPSCDFCNGLGLIKPDVPPGHPMAGKFMMCPKPNCEAAATIRERKHNLLLDYSGVPGEYRKLSFATFWALSDELRTGKTLAAAVMEAAASAWPDNYHVNIYDVAARFGMEYLYSPHEPARNWFVLQGDLGVGKTGLAAALANQLVDNQRGAVYYRLSNLFQEIQDRYDYDPSDPESVRAGSSSDIKDMLNAAEFLILDEMNIHDGSRNKLKIVEDLIRDRAAHQRATVFTCNSDEAGMRALWGGRTVDSICERAHWITLDGERLRRGSNRIGGW